MDCVCSALLSEDALGLWAEFHQDNTRYCLDGGVSKYSLRVIAPESYALRAEKWRCSWGVLAGADLWAIGKVWFFHHFPWQSPSEVAEVVEEMSWPELSQGLFSRSCSGETELRSPLDWYLNTGPHVFGLELSTAWSRLNLCTFF